MHLKNVNAGPVDGWHFYYDSPVDGKPVRVPSGTKNCNGRKQLTTQVKSAFLQNKIAIPPNLEQIIEHQICLRQPNPKEACWQDGVGDKIHNWVAKPLTKAAAERLKKMGATGLGQKVQKIGSCSACGGTRSYKAKDRYGNLGRAGVLNRLGRKRKSG